MNYTTSLSKEDREVVQRLKDFVPEEVFDIHAHLYHASHFGEGAIAFLKDVKQLRCEDHRAALKRYMPSAAIHGLYFGLPHKSADRAAASEWISSETRDNGTSLSRALMLVSPDDDRERTAGELRSGKYCGIKVYHCYAPRADTMNASVREYAPEWMWELLNETDGVLMLHIVRHEASADALNQADLRWLCSRYPRVKVVLAHIGRSFNYRHGRAGLPLLSDLGNVYVDTSAICESEAFRAALRHFGIHRMLWGSDFPVSEMRGRCISTGNGFFWLHPELISNEHRPPMPIEMTMIGIESLLCLREACEDEGLSKSDVKDIFFNNAVRLLKPHLDQDVHSERETGPALWTHAREVISGGTGLLSKRAEMFHPEWPSYFSRAKGCEVRDLEGRRYVDFAGGIGSVLLGYADDHVDSAVRRRLLSGTYSSLANPDEVRLADALLSLHPWASAVRYARGGGEGMALAVRLARALTGRSGVAFCGYHGWHDWYLAANIADDHALDGHLLPGLSPHGVPRELKGTSVPFRYNDLASFEHAVESLRGNLAAVVMEPMRSEFPKDDFVARVAARCRAEGAVFVLDEVTSGLRYGFPGAHSHMNITPDLAVYAKAMSNGYPFAAVVGNEDVMRAGERSFISSSYWTDGVGPAAALAVLEKMQRMNVQPDLWTNAVVFRDTLVSIAARCPELHLRVGGMPVSPSLTFGDRETHATLMPLFIAGMQQEGYLTNSTLYLMHAHGAAHFSDFLKSFERVLRLLEGMVASGTLPQRQEKPGKNTGFARLA